MLRQHPRKHHISEICKVSRDKNVAPSPTSLSILDSYTLDAPLFQDAIKLALQTTLASTEIEAPLEMLLDSVPRPAQICPVATSR